MSLTDINSFGVEFVSKVRENLPKDFNIQDLKILTTGLILVPNEEKQGYRPLGCPECLGVKPEQNAEGYPTINGKRLLTAEEAQQSVKDIPTELIANLWLCPKCKIPLSSLLPQFDLSAL